MCFLITVIADQYILAGLIIVTKSYRRSIIYHQNTSPKPDVMNTEAL